MLFFFLYNTRCGTSPVDDSYLGLAKMNSILEEAATLTSSSIDFNFNLFVVGSCILNTLMKKYCKFGNFREGFIFAKLC